DKNIPFMEFVPLRLNFGVLKERGRLPIIREAALSTSRPACVHSCSARSEGGRKTPDANRCAVPCLGPACSPCASFLPNQSRSKPSGLHPTIFPGRTF